MIRTKDGKLYLLSEYQEYMDWAKSRGVRVQFEDEIYDDNETVECAIIRAKSDRIFRRCYSLEEIVGFLAGLIENGGGWDDKD